MNGRNPTAAEKVWLSYIIANGCAVCNRELMEFTEPSPHHMAGCRKQLAHFKTIPLCANHHQYQDTEKPPRWLAFHHNKTQWEKRYGTQWEMWENLVDKFTSDYCCVDSEIIEILQGIQNAHTN